MQTQSNGAYDFKACGLLRSGATDSTFHTCFLKLIPFHLLPQIDCNAGGHVEEDANGVMKPMLFVSFEERLKCFHPWVN